MLTKIQVWELHRHAKCILSRILEGACCVPREGEEIYVNGVYREVTRVSYDYLEVPDTLNGECHVEVEIEVAPIEGDYEF